MPERPRDRLGRPLPIDTDPSDAAPLVIDVTGLDDDAVWSIAVDYLDQGMPFHAHEVFEQRWRSTEGPEKEAWRALAQWGAALTHEARGNEEGAQRLAFRALASLASAGQIPTCIDVARVETSCEALTADPDGTVSG